MVPYTYDHMTALPPDNPGLSCHEAPPGLPLASATTTAFGNVSITVAASMMLAVCVYMTGRIMRGLQNGRTQKGKPKQNQQVSIPNIDTPHKCTYMPPASASATEQCVFLHDDNSLIVKLGQTLVRTDTTTGFDQDDKLPHVCTPRTTATCSLCTSDFLGVHAMRVCASLFNSDCTRLGMSDYLILT